MFQSPQNRGYSSDPGSACSGPAKTPSFNPLRIGAIPQIARPPQKPKEEDKVSIPSESGLFLRSAVALLGGFAGIGFNPLRIGAIPQIDRRRVVDEARGSFQSPQNRGYSSDTRRTVCLVKTNFRFNPLRIGAIPQIRSCCTRRTVCFGSFNPLRIGAIPQMTMLRKRTLSVLFVSIPSESGLFLRSAAACPMGFCFDLVSIPSESGLFLRSAPTGCCHDPKYSSTGCERFRYSVGV